jgi:hypothetical protein
MINQTLKYSLILVAIGTFLAWLITFQMNAFALLMGTLWGSANFYLISLLTQNILINKSYIAASWLMLLKFPLLYGIGYQILKLNIGDPLFILIGFTLVLVAMLVRSCFYLTRRPL